MKKIIIFIFLLANVCAENIQAQTAQEYLKSCVQEAKENGATSVIVRATLCSACEGVYEGFIFSKSETFKVRYIKYFDGYQSVKVIKDTTLIDSEIQKIFEIEEQYQDTIINQLKNMETLLATKVIKDGKILFQQPLNHGKMMFIGIYNNEKSASSIHSILSLNSLFERAYYYWLLNSFINNYIIDLNKSNE